MSARPHPVPQSKASASSVKDATKEITKLIDAYNEKLIDLGVTFLSEDDSSDHIRQHFTKQMYYGNTKVLKIGFDEMMGKINTMTKDEAKSLESKAFARFKTVASLQNSNGDPVKLGSGSGSKIYYCGKKRTGGSSCPCGSCDSNCGPTNGCPCVSCSEFNEKDEAEGSTQKKKKKKKKKKKGKSESDMGQPDFPRYNKNKTKNCVTDGTLANCCCILLGLAVFFFLMTYVGNPFASSNEKLFRAAVTENDLAGAKSIFAKYPELDFYETDWSQNSPYDLAVAAPDSGTNNEMFTFLEANILLHKQFVQSAGNLQEDTVMHMYATDFWLDKHPNSGAARKVCNDGACMVAKLNTLNEALTWVGGTSMQTILFNLPPTPKGTFMPFDVNYQRGNTPKGVTALGKAMTSFTGGYSQIEQLLKHPTMKKSTIQRELDSHWKLSYMGTSFGDSCENPICTRAEIKEKKAAALKEYKSNQQYILLNKYGGEL